MLRSESKSVKIYQSQSQSLHLVLRELGNYTTQAPNSAYQFKSTRMSTDPHQPYESNSSLYCKQDPNQPNEPTEGIQAAPQNSFPNGVDAVHTNDAIHSQPAINTTETIGAHSRAIRNQNVDRAQNHNFDDSLPYIAPLTPTYRQYRSSLPFDHHNQEYNNSGTSSTIMKQTSEQKFAQAPRQAMQHTSYISTSHPDNFQSLNLKLKALQTEVESMEAILKVAEKETPRLPYVNALQNRHRGLAHQIQDLTNELTNASYKQNTTPNHSLAKSDALVQDFLRQLRQQRELAHNCGKAGGSRPSEAIDPRSSSTSQAAFLIQNHNGPYAIVYNSDKTYISPQRGPQITRIDPNVLFRNRTGPSITAHTNLPNNNRTTALPLNVAQPRQNQNQNRNQNAENNARGEQNAEQGLQNIAGRLWLLVQTIGFIFLFGGSLGRTRQLIFLALSLLFHAAQLGLLGDRWARLRQHLEGLIPAVEGGGGRQRRRERRPRTGTRQSSTRSSRREEARQQSDVSNRPSLTPENTARRLVRQQQARLWDTLTEHFRALERIVALFVATLWPGVGERHVAARRNADAEANRENENEPETEVTEQTDQAEQLSSAVAEGSSSSTGREFQPSSSDDVTRVENKSGQVPAEDRTQTIKAKNDEIRSDTAS